MSYLIHENSAYRSDIEQTHSEFATAYGRDNVLVVERAGKLIVIIGEHVGVPETESVTLADSKEAVTDHEFVNEASTGRGIVGLSFQECEHSPDVHHLHVLNGRNEPKHGLPTRAAGMDTPGPEGVENHLIPLFEASKEWFEDVYEQFYLSIGGTAELVDVTPEGVKFQAFYADEGEWRHREEVESRLEANDKIEDAVVVESEEQAKAIGEQATWMRVERDAFWVSEWVPFDEPATTRAQLETELDELMEHTPHWDSLFESVAEIVTEDIPLPN
jgi:hypothetical protein